MDKHTHTHTPLPWRLDYNAIVHLTGTPAAIQVGTVDDMRPVDREFVVRACNAHYKLVDALRELTAIVRGECPALLDEDRDGYGELSVRIDALLT